MGEKLTSIAKSSGNGKKKKDTRVEVRQIKNGFIIRKTVEYNDEKKGWQYLTEEYFSETDPLEITDKSLAELFD